MQITAAVARRPHEDFSVEVLDLAPPGPHEVLVEVRGVGLCHTDLVARDQEYPVPLPAVLGHEGAGVVVETGSSVTAVRPGQAVVCSFHSCGRCRLCRGGRPSYCEDAFALNFGCRRADGTTPLTAGGEPVGGSFFGQSTFATHAVVHERSLVPVADDVPVELLGPLGCGVQTGAGAVLNALRPSPLSRLVVFGAGSVGLSAVMAAVVAGCRQIVAVDTKPARLELARELGATDTIDASSVDLGEAVAEVTGGGADYTLEVTGNPAVARQAVDGLVPGGVCGLIGAAPMGATGSFDMNSILFGRTVRGIIEGDAVPQVFIPQLVDLWRAGRFPFDRLVRPYRLDQINDAVRDAHSGGTVKAVLHP